MSSSIDEKHVGQDFVSDESDEEEDEEDNDDEDKDKDEAVETQGLSSLEDRLHEKFEESITISDDSNRAETRANISSTPSSGSYDSVSGSDQSNTDGAGREATQQQTVAAVSL